MKITVDQRADALYISFRQTSVSRTMEINPGTLVDVDHDGEVVGIEIIGASSAQWPLDELLKRFNFRPADENILTMLSRAKTSRRPSSTIGTRDQSEQPGRHPILCG